MGIIPHSLTTLAKGLSFESRTIGILREHLSISCRHVGGRGDGGIDLLGWWWLPHECLSHAAYQDSSNPVENRPARTPLRIFAQCKAEEKKIGPRYVREFEGTILRNCLSQTAGESGGSVTGLSRNAAVGVFASTSPFTKASLLQAYSSPLPLVLLYLPNAPVSVSNVESGSSPLGALVFNPALNGASGLLRDTVEARWERLRESEEGRPRLWYNGRPLESWTPDENFEGIPERLD
ncbi:hypothetical protein BD309DRAFT_962960 [Dichomitus squalens]|uniref:Restriction endonuclease type IV Mrr domain-containing protein n=1 Tax=Dichomitus squalens TaxID=114155 RepID=A0A4Q9MHS1_9APHY|nr:uncharacterized protein DICSQDRAFT_101830 [Dichomitus squalens LYAD-421 SS1]EJF63792.1 hypothetical protein DICSQDRAFT_101830 [Dichomitus squalens LYAD-421 SS1]TBU26168.1 hypothetical protein BD311DRAFT_460336 [Dichomitus squalens]TBU42472.1 hypothetical protein BD309DRAFT_962960 [Dichomitus squalens]TBU61170.1 hypothetical protein BD310DRAFT_240107 [Dichomitus squalens]